MNVAKLEKIEKTEGEEEDLEKVVVVQKTQEVVNKAPEEALAYKGSKLESKKTTYEK